MMAATESIAIDVPDRNRTLFGTGCIREVPPWQSTWSDTMHPAKGFLPGNAEIRDAELQEKKSQTCLLFL